MNKPTKAKREVATLALSSVSSPCKFATSVLLVSGLSRLCTSPSSKGSVKPVRLLHHLTLGSNSLKLGTVGPGLELEAGSLASSSSSSWITSAALFLLQASFRHGALGNDLVELVATTSGALDGALLPLGLVHFARLSARLCSSVHLCLRHLLGVGDLPRFRLCIRLTGSSCSGRGSGRAPGTCTCISPVVALLSNLTLPCGVWVLFSWSSSARAAAFGGVVAARFTNCGSRSEGA